jgi:IS5 family transposase
LSVKLDVDYHLIREFETVTASQHDATIEQIKEGDIAAYRDKGYFGVFLPKKVLDFTMDRAVRGRPLTKEQKERNRRISSVRSPGERPFSVIKTVFNAERDIRGLEGLISNLSCRALPITSISSLH